MSENQNVNNEENPQAISQAVSDLLTDICNNTAPSSASQNSLTSSRYDNPQRLINNPSHPPVRQAQQERSPQRQVHGNQNEVKPTYEIYRATGQFTDSQSDMDVGHYVSRMNDGTQKRTIPPSAPLVPPSYSTVIKQGRPSLDIRRDVRSMETQHLSPFTRVPPPSYAEVHGVWSREFSNASSEQILLGPDPIYIWCTHCATVVITVTHSQRSKFTHLTAAALCLFGCWPCAMLPYCMNSCKNIYHYCPDCNYLFGMYRPW